MTEKTPRSNIDGIVRSPSQKRTVSPKKVSEEPGITATPANNTTEPVATNLLQDTRPSYREQIANGMSRGVTWAKLHWKMLLLGFVGTIALLVVAVLLYVYQFAKNDITDKDGQLNFLQQIGHVASNNTPIKGEAEDRVNVLLMGKGGEGHDGGELVDTVMVASIKPSTGEVALLSLPRDLVVPYTPEGKTKPTEYPRVNQIMYKGGIDFARDAMKTIFGIDVDYYAVVDFSGFRNIVDTLDGVDIAVPNGFTGYYGANELSTPCPKADKATLADGVYCAITFSAGTQHMDGEKALQYARIRKMAPGSESNEGSDFKRAARQQLVLQAIKDKSFSASTLFNPVRANGLLNDLGDHISTDMEVWEMLRLATLVKDVDRSKIKNVVIDQGEDGLVKRIAGAEAYLLEPTAGPTDYSEIQAVALHVFDQVSTETADAKQAIENEKAVTVIQNGTTTEGLASKLAKKTQLAGIPVTSFMNAATKTNATTTIFDLTGNTKPATKAALEAQFGVTAVSGTLSTTTGKNTITSDSPVDMVETTELPNNTDFIVILGADAAATTTPAPATNTTTPTNTTKNTNTSSTNTASDSSVKIIPTTR